jgi:hypothetical protein
MVWIFAGPTDFCFGYFLPKEFVIGPKKLLLGISADFLLGYTLDN